VASAICFAERPQTGPVATQNGTPVLVRDWGRYVRAGPFGRCADGAREGKPSADRRDARCQNSLTVIDGVREKAAEIKPALPPGVELVSGYEPLWIDSCVHRNTATRLLERPPSSAWSPHLLGSTSVRRMIPILTLPIAGSQPSSRYYLHVTSHHVLGGFGAANLPSSWTA